MNMAKQDGDWVGQAAKMREELSAWNKAHPDATLDEIVAWVTPRRRELMGQLVEEMATAECEAAEEEVLCPDCGKPVDFRAWRERQVIHFEGDSTLKRRYYYCPRCERGVFPPGRAS